MPGYLVTENVVPNIFGHDIQIHYKDLYNGGVCTYSVGMHQAEYAINKLYEIAKNSSFELIGVSCPAEFLNEMQYADVTVIQAIDSILPGMV